MLGGKPWWQISSHAARGNRIACPRLPSYVLKGCIRELPGLTLTHSRSGLCGSPFAKCHGIMKKHIFHGIAKVDHCRLRALPVRGAGRPQRSSRALPLVTGLLQACYLQLQLKLRSTNDEMRPVANWGKPKDSKIP